MPSIDFIELTPKPQKPNVPSKPQPQTVEAEGDVINSPEIEFKNFTELLEKEVNTLKERQLFTKKEVWFKLNAHCLRFVGRCADNDLREEAFRIVKYLVDTVPAADELKDKELDSPFAKNMDLTDILSDRKDGRTLAPNEVK